MIDFLNLLATSVLAIAAVIIARNANIIAHNANVIAGNGNDISERATKLEADKHLIEWSYRVLTCISSVVGLRMLTQGEIDLQTFKQKRREHRASLLVLKEEGQLFFRDRGDANSALKAIQQVYNYVRGDKFVLPPATYKEVENDVQRIRDEARTFMRDIQARIGDHWTR
jgi:hypothetical protein